MIGMPTAMLPSCQNVSQSPQTAEQLDNNMWTVFAVKHSEQTISISSKSEGKNTSTKATNLAHQRHPHKSQEDPLLIKIPMEVPRGFREHVCICMSKAVCYNNKDSGPENNGCRVEKQSFQLRRAVLGNVEGKI